ncbi:MAG: hypothetical protein ACE366_01060 [Bradymonadia bacterium]
MAVLLPQRFKDMRSAVKAVGSAMLQASSEAPLGEARWLMASHGGVMQLVSPHPEHFERRLIVLPRPDGEGERWADRCDRRIKCLDTHLKESSMGRIVQHAFLETGCFCVVMIRPGLPLQALDPKLLDEQQVAGLLTHLISDLERYLKLTRDEQLLHLSSLEVARVPQKGQKASLRVKLDATALVTGLSGPPRPLTEAQVVSGVCRLWSSKIKGWGRIGDPQVALMGPWLARRRAHSLSRSLNGLAERLEKAEPSRAEIDAWLAGMS